MFFTHAKRRRKQSAGRKGRGITPLSLVCGISMTKRRRIIGGLRDLEKREGFSFLGLARSRCPGLFFF
jgi:hypothetical protein